MLLYLYGMTLFDVHHFVQFPESNDCSPKSTCLVPEAVHSFFKIYADKYIAYAGQNKISQYILIHTLLKKWLEKIVFWQDIIMSNKLCIILLRFLRKASGLLHAIIILWTWSLFEEMSSCHHFNAFRIPFSFMIQSFQSLFPFKFLEFLSSKFFLQLLSTVHFYIISICNMTQT